MLGILRTVERTYTSCYGHGNACIYYLHVNFILGCVTDRILYSIFIIFTTCKNVYIYLSWTYRTLFLIIEKLQYNIFFILPV